MKVCLISKPDHREWRDIIKRLAPLQEKITIHVYAPGYEVDNGEIGAAKTPVFYDRLDESLKGADMIINLLGCPEPDYAGYKPLAGKYHIDLHKAKTLGALLSGDEIWREMDRLAAAINDANLQEAVIINAGRMPDIITAYLKKAHHITGYGISRKADQTVDTLLEATSLSAYRGRLTYKLAGVCDHLWVAEIADQDGKDFYPQLREKIKDLDLNITRNDLTGEGLRSLKFYGYYHSANVAAQATAEIIFKLISAYLSAEKTTVYLNAVNDGSINGLDTDAVVEIPFIFTDRKISREKVNLPLPCVLAIDDPAGAVIMTVKTLITKSATIFKRTIKLDPYLAPRLTLAELDDLAEGLLQHGGLKGLFKEE